MSEAAFLDFLGLAARGGSLVYGQEAGLKSVRSGRARLVVLDGSTSERTRKTFADSCSAHHVPLVILGGHDVLGSAIGKQSNRIVAVTQESFASKALEKWEGRSRGSEFEQN